MKWIVYLLLLANATYFSLELRAREPAPPPLDLSIASARVNALPLISETDPAALRERAGASGTAVAALPALQGVPLPEGQAAAGAGAPGSGGGDAGATAGGSAPPAPDARAAGPLAGAPPGACYSAGPLEVDEVEPMRAWIVARDGRALLREDERREVALWWVFFPPLADRAAATARVEQMRNEGLADIYIIPRGDMANAISLGVYSRQDSLERRLAQMRARGYEPSVSPRYTTRRAAWFDIHFEEGFSFDPAAFAAKFPATEMAPVPCTARIAGAPAPGDGGAGAASAPPAAPAPAASPPAKSSGAAAPAARAEGPRPLAAGELVAEPATASAANASSTASAPRPRAAPDTVASGDTASPGAESAGRSFYPGKFKASDLLGPAPSQ